MFYFLISAHRKDLEETTVVMITSSFQILGSNYHLSLKGAGSSGEMGDSRDDQRK